MTEEGEAARSADRKGERFGRVFEDLAEVYQPDFPVSRRLASGVEGTRSGVYGGRPHPGGIRRMPTTFPSVAGQATTSWWK